MIYIPDFIKEKIYTDYDSQIVSLDNAIRDYETVLLSQFEKLLPIARELQPRRILDIGCGFAGMDALLAKAGIGKIFHLLDGEGRHGKKLKWSDEAPSPWNYAGDGGTLLRLNAPADVQIHAYGPKPWLTIPCDLLLSLRSWCHHYPADVYIGLVKRSLRPGGILITDIRRGTDGLEVLKNNGFKIFQKIDDNTEKSDRFAFI